MHDLDTHQLRFETGTSWREWVLVAVVFLGLASSAVFFAWFG